MGDLEERLARLGARVAEADGPDEAAIAAARERFARSPRRARRAPALRGALAIAAAAALGLGAWYALRDDAPRRYTVDGAPGETDAWIASHDAAVNVGFDDGTQFVLHPSGRARVTELGVDGATVRLEGGRLDADVVHRPSARWEVCAGPYRVLVTGTRFEIEWEPEPERLTVRMIEGAVRVSGPLLEPARALAAGQVLTADADEVSVRRGAPATAATEAPAPEPPAPSEAAAPAGEEPAEEAPTNASRVAPSDRAALWAAADRARYAGRAEEARRALLALRRDHHERGRTSFLLGALAADAGDRGEAIRWFETYLREHPRGALAEASLGRLVELQRSRSVAERYLASYPEGSHARLAREVLARTR